MTNQADVLRWLIRIADLLGENWQYLTQLDTPIGDADHGMNMDRRFAAARTHIPVFHSMDTAGTLRSVGTTLVSTVGGAGGPLWR
jgi:dihydroxyacetone kinase-like protein